MAMHLVTDIRNDGRAIAHTATEARYLDACEVAKVARKRLAVAFPGVKFSVKTDKYSMGSSIDVSWTDGPTEGQVSAIVGMLNGSTFDGMIDLKSYKGAQSIPEFAEPVTIGNDHMFTNRRISPALDLAVRRRFARTYSTHNMTEYDIDTRIARMIGRATLVNGHLMIAKEQY